MLATSSRLSFKASAALFTASVATLVPVLPNVPVSSGVRSVSAKSIETMPARVLSTDAATWRCALMMPFPNSHDPMAR